MPELAWATIPAVFVAAVIFGFFPGAATRLIVLIYPKGHPRRRELVAEVYVIEHRWRIVWVFEQLELAIFEGLPTRLRNSRHARQQRRARGALLKLFRHGVAAEWVKARRATNEPVPLETLSGRRTRRLIRSYRKRLKKLSKLARNP